MYIIIFLDLRKAFDTDTVDKKQLLEILEGYGIGPTACGLLKSHWDTQSCVATQEKKAKELIFRRTRLEPRLNQILKSVQKK